MIIVSDTSPLNYLILVGHEDLLRTLFGRVVIPQVVFDELRGKGAPFLVVEWINRVPDWIEIRQPQSTANASLDFLDAGEREAILLAQELSAELLLVDDRQARDAAVNLEIPITGTVGILDRAARLGLIDLREVINKLKETNFYISEDLIEKLLDQNS